ncbi:helix-turn-helix domain-containing protein [Gracilibacillus marinus]|jgi:AraC family transcriptional regulator, transcriptional activator of pobA|uniref:Helix-turn-helix domain-containing protein n=1 Tax=Gracilibacillus marinus TaxID=630535 RepID=A0ABV8VQJ8_9BACI
MNNTNIPISLFKIQHKDNKKTVKDFHAHAGYEIVWVRNGEAKFIFDEKIIHLKQDHLLFFRSTAFHKVQIIDGPPYERVVIMFTDDFFSVEQPVFLQFKQLLDTLPLPYCSLPLFMWRKEPFQQIINQLLKEDQNIHGWEQKQAIELLLTQLLLYICREMHADKNEHLLASDHDLDGLLLQERIVKEINAIWQTNWQLDELADRLHFNKYYLCHFFKREFGMTIQQYILQKRMFEAKKMLVHSSIAINEIATSVGFSSASNFIRCFKKYVHMTPKQYRDEKSPKLMKV